MRYWTATIVGVGLFVASVVAFSTSLTDLLDAGTCASGNQPFEISRECPEGTGTSALLLTGSIFGLLAAAVIVAARGVRSASSRPRSSMLLAGWAIFFSATGLVSLLHATTSDVVGPDGKLGGIIVGATFLIMGLPVLAFVLWDMVSRLRGRDERPSFPGAPGGLTGRAVARLIESQGQASNSQTQAWSSSGFGTAGAPAADPTLDQLERLQRLRQEGVLSEAEFADQKSRILEG